MGRQAVAYKLHLSFCRILTSPRLLLLLVQQEAHEQHLHKYFLRWQHDWQMTSTTTVDCKRQKLMEGFGGPGIGGWNQFCDDYLTRVAKYFMYSALTVLKSWYFVVFGSWWLTFAGNNVAPHNWWHDRIVVEKHADSMSVHQSTFKNHLCPPHRMFAPPPSRASR